MHFILATVGTDGDVFPHIGLGAQLLRRGHQVTLAAPATYQARAENLGLGFCSLVTREEVQQMLADPDLWHPLRSGWMMAKWIGPMIPRQYGALAKLVETPDSVIVANPGILSARLLQEKLGIPTASLILQPGILPSNIAPPEMTGGLTLPSWLPGPFRHAYWLAVDAAAYMLVTTPLNRFRASLGLRPIRRLFRWWMSPDLVVGLFPDWYAPPPADWPHQLRLAGFGRFDGARGDLPDDIQRFCQQGSPPIAFTLGTGMQHAADFFRNAVKTCESLGLRALMLTKYRELLPDQLPNGVIHCPYAPFRQLLPLCAALVHHGGIGTTASALDAGCPQLIVPLAWDQPDNAARVERLQVGLSLSARSRSHRQMSEALYRLLAEPYSERCRTYAAEARSIDGLSIAADWVEQFGKQRREGEPQRNN